MGRQRLYSTDPKPCAVCGTMMTLRDTDEGSWQFAKRSTCGPECMVEARARKRRQSFSSKSCVICGGEYTRREDELCQSFRLRKTCSDKCKFALIAASKRTRTKARAPRARMCVACGGEVPWEEGVLPSVFLLRKTCSVECARRLRAETRRKPRTTRECVICGVEFSEEGPRGAPSVFVRQTCSQECRGVLTARNRRKNPNYTRTTPYPTEWTPKLKAAIRARDGNECAFCGVRHHLHVHHIDYVKDNCDSANLITLCRLCHHQTTHLGDRVEWTAICRAILTMRGVLAM